MRTLLNTLILAALTVPSVAMAADASPHTFTSNVGLVSNYLYRGISQTGAQAAMQGGFDYAHSSGFYAGVWGSNISWLSDAGIASTASVELDTYAGYKGTAGDVGYDVGFLRYNYPGTYVAGAVKADTNEIYGAVSYSIVTAKYSYSLGDTFGVPDAQGTNYLDLSANYTLPETGIALGAHYGKQTYKGSSARYLASVAAGSATYSDYKLSVTKDFSGYVLGLAYSSTNASPFYTSLQNKQLGKGTAVLSLTRSF
ncbi:MAG: TorF family putative porin [Gallionella sp.]|nr:TorF family putative porin [Gallionella sp.]